MRPSGRAPDALRPVRIETGVSRHAEGSCVIRLGDTHVHCTATLEERVPPFLKGTGRGWVTAEYAMLPRATTTRSRRERDGAGGRTQEIQRLVGRSLRAGVDLVALGERQVTVDCDVLQADGGTRCAAITGGWVALRLAVSRLMAARAVLRDPLDAPVAAVSVGLYGGVPVLDLDYPEDSEAGVDANVVMAGDRLVEVQMTAERGTFGRAEMDALLALAEGGLRQLAEAQRAAVAGAMAGAGAG